MLTQAQNANGNMMLWWCMLGVITDLHGRSTYTPALRRVGNDELASSLNPMRLDPVHVSPTYAFKDAMLPVPCAIFAFILCFIVFASLCTCIMRIEVTAVVLPPLEMCVVRDLVRRGVGRVLFVEKKPHHDDRSLSGCCIYSFNMVGNSFLPINTQ